MDNQDWINLDSTEIAHKYYNNINHHIFSLFRVKKKFHLNIQSIVLLVLVDKKTTAD